MHSVGLELTKLTYTRLEDNLIRHRGATGPHYRRLSLQHAAPSLSSYKGIWFV